MAVAYLAVSSTVTCAPLNPAYSVEEFKFFLADLHAKALITSFGIGHPVHQAAGNLNIPIIYLESDQEYAGLFSLKSNIPLFPNLPKEPILASLNDIALVLHTSGTTSRPKIVPLTHWNILYSIHNIADTYLLTPSDRCLNMMPLFHIHGLIGALSSSLSPGQVSFAHPVSSPTGF